MTSGIVQVSLEAQIAEWRGYLRRRQAINGSDVEELESHLRDEVGALVRSGLGEDEAFLVAVKRMGSLDVLSREFAREHSERLWKQLVLSSGGEAQVPGPVAEPAVVLALALAAAAAIKIPELFGVAFGAGGERFYARNLGFFALPLLAAYFGWKRRLAVGQWGWLSTGFVVAAVLVNAFPFGPRSNTEVLAALHLPIALWFVVGVAYMGGRWLDGNRRMDFVRFSGELFIYYVLMALGGVLLSGFTTMIFSAIGMNVGRMLGTWLIPCGAMGAVIVGSWLVEAKQSVIENMAPVLTRLFTPLFTLVLLAFLGAMVWTGRPIDIERDVLIAFDLLLVVVVGLVLYSASARDAAAPPKWFDGLQLLLIASALAVDVVALAAVASRISEFGFTPNRVAALGENLILLANLAGSAWLYARFLRGRAPFHALEAWQTAYLPVYPFWAALVVAIFPPLFVYA